MIKFLEALNQAIIDAISAIPRVFSESTDTLAQWWGLWMLVVILLFLVIAMVTTLSPQPV